ncbi:hypothetical protein [Paenibacillus sp. FSL R5-0519]|uniref:hypothetical protein n=1 Tax=Paenibacillus sp. FSL R5-0519 TaxID=2921648 RepID=UPI0030DA18AF
MHYERDILTIDEVFEFETEETMTVIRAVNYALREGDSFFIIAPGVDTSYVVEAVDLNDYSCTVIYDGGKRVDIKDVFPLFSVGSLISMLSFNNEFDLRTAGPKWIVIFDDNQEYASEENELLVTFLWHVLLDLCARGMIG